MEIGWVQLGVSIVHLLGFLVDKCRRSHCDICWGAVSAKLSRARSDELISDRQNGSEENV